MGGTNTEVRHALLGRQARPRQGGRPVGLVDLDVGPSQSLQLPCPKGSRMRRAPGAARAPGQLPQKPRKFFFSGSGRTDLAARRCPLIEATTFLGTAARWPFFM